METKRIVVPIPRADWLGLRRLAEDRPAPDGRASVSVILRGLIRQELARREQQSPGPQ